MTREQFEHTTILVVDDTPANLQVILEHLADTGARIFVARNGEGALKQAVMSKPDLILLDIMMPPGIDGFETCRRIKQHAALKNIPIIFLSSLSDPVNKVEGIEAGGADYIAKPFDAVELLARIKTHLTLCLYRKALEQTNKELQQANEALLKSRKKLEIAASIDPLTELPNRRDMLAKLEYERIRFERQQSPFTVALCDVDHFKQLNDRFGHDCGDAVLVALARVMRSLIRKQDVVARWGGEEFLLLLPETNADGGYTVCEKMRAIIEEQIFRHNQHKLSVTITVGLSIFDFHENSVEKPIREADSALYHGKRRGRNQVVTYDMLSE